MYCKLYGGVEMKTAIALGTFDGLHSAHRKVLTLPDGYKKLAVTFKMPPKMVIFNNSELIISHNKKSEYLKEIGFDEIITLNFCDVRDISPLDFLNYLKNDLNAEFISCGFNYNFGKNGKGNTDLLSEFCKENQIELMVSAPVVLENGQLLSSSYIRSLLKNGETEKANKLLYKPFSFEGQVLAGDRRGRTIGFPTINQKYPNDLVKLRFGVYKTKVLFDKKSYDGITNIGIRPTYETDFAISETFIKDFSGDLYGKNVEIVPLKFLREEKRFSSLDELKKQIELDLEN